MPKSEQAKQRKRDAARAKKQAAQEQGTDGAQQRETAGAAERERGNYRYVDELDAVIATAVARELEKGGDEPELNLDERFVLVGLKETIVKSMAGAITLLRQAGPAYTVHGVKYNTSLRTKATTPEKWESMTEDERHKASIEAHVAQTQGSEHTANHMAPGADTTEGSEEAGVTAEGGTSSLQTTATGDTDPSKTPQRQSKQHEEYDKLWQEAHEQAVQAHKPGHGAIADEEIELAIKEATLKIYRSKKKKMKLKAKKKEPTDV